MVVPPATSKANLKKLTGKLRDLVRKKWPRTTYEIVDINEEYRSGQAFIYFQLKRKETALINPRLLSTPLPKVTPPAEPSVRKKSRSKRVIKKSKTPRKHKRVKTKSKR